MTTIPLHHLQEKFTQEGLPFPSIPTQLQDSFQELVPWTYSTRSDIPSPYQISWFINELGTQPTIADYSVLAHAGHGMNSYAIHYYLVRGNLALFLQIAWGGVYTDNDKAVKEIATAYLQAEQLMTKIENAQLDRNERIIGVVSDFYGSRWAHLKDIRDQEQFLNPNNWNSKINILPTLLSLPLH